MKNVMRLLPAVLLVGILALSGCGKKEEEPTRFNRTLGDSPITAPLGTGSIDTGIFQDQTAYRPAPYEPLEPEAGSGVESGGPEVEAIRGVLVDYFAAVLDLSVESILDMYVPEQVAILTEDPYMSTLFDTRETLSTFWATLQDKVAGSELEALNGAVVRLGRETGVATPVHGFIYAALTPMEARVR